MSNSSSNGGAQPKVLVIGLDGIPSNLLFNDLLKDLPNIKTMADNGLFATLESCHPPITVPAWMVMMTSKSPGELGIYGWRHRKGFSYNEGWIANSLSIKEPRVWDLLAKEGKKVCLIGIPPSYPPTQVNGSLISCSLTPKNSKSFTHPPQLAGEVENIVGGNYLFDIPFRIEDRNEALNKLYEMTDKRFKVINHLLKKGKWDYFMFVEIGFDRLHHMFWKYYDSTHPKYEPSNKYHKVIPEYYKYVDGKIGEILSTIDDDTYVLLVSDHGTASMKGAFCINEWLINEGYLVLKKYPNSIADLDNSEVDWDKTTAWGWGGYYARIFFNVKGRESNGKIPMDKFHTVREDLKRKLLTIEGPQGQKFDNKVFCPEDLYDESNGSKPDLIVYLDNLSWRSAGTIGHNTFYLSENDAGPDDSVHWMDGVFILYKRNRVNHSSNPSNGNNIKMNNLSIYDVAPTILDIMNSPIPAKMQGKVVEEVSKWIHN
jgi:predicted AlkP superfamily phosphohydrolase/phosphomutase